MLRLKCMKMRIKSVSIFAILIAGPLLFLYSSTYAAPFVPPARPPAPDGIVACRDTDGGENFFQAGTVTAIIRRNGRVSTKTLHDESPNVRILLERTCNNATLTIQHDCRADGMVSQNGACVRPNRAPRLRPIGNQQVNENQELTFQVIADDPDGDLLIYTARRLPQGATFVSNTFRWIPTFDQAGDYTAIFSVSDGRLTDREGIRIAVHNVNRAPILHPLENQEVNEGELIQFEITAEDPDGDNLVYSAEGLPAGAIFEDRVFRWTPTNEQSGVHEIIFDVSDGSLHAEMTVVITVHNINQPPVFLPLGNQEIDENQELRFEVKANDPNNDVLLYFAAGLPHGASFDGNTRIFSWIPTYDQASVYNVTFVAIDEQFQTRLIVTITVQNVNRVPSLEAIGNQEIMVGNLIHIELHGTDPDNDVLSFNANPLPAGSSLVGNIFNWTPNDNQIGSQQITFVVSDGDLQDQETISVNVLQHTTPIGGVIQQNTTLTRTSSPYLVTHHILVPEGIMLTIEPGVMLRFDGNYYIRVEGTFIADGTEERRIIFTSNKQNPQPGDWDKIRFMDTSTDWNGVSGSVIRYSTFEYSGGGGQPSNATIAAEGASPLIENNEVFQFETAFIWTTRSNSIIRYNIVQGGVILQGGGAGYIIAVSDGNGLIVNNTISNNNGGNGQFTGIACDNAASIIENNLVENNSGKGVSGSCSSIIRNNTIINNARGGMHVWGGAIITDNIVSGNGQIGIELQGDNNTELFGNTISGSDIGVDISNNPIGRFERNTIINNRNGIRILGNSRANLHNNNIYNNSEYNFYIRKNGNPIGDMEAQNNWWGTTDPEEIEDMIWDWNDDFDLPHVVFEPFAGAPFE